MQFKVISALALATLATATAVSRRNDSPPPTPASQCSTGPVQCCTDGGKASSSVFAPILALLGLNVIGDALVGTGCADVPVVGVGSGAECNSFAYCCEDNSHSLISVSCLPVILDL